ncbi:UPF0182 family protein [Bacillaceae bacterium Marseille-Q3522]|nr:UPF0182 family protein [Bacillaceae bacterium Marseille-Q3522]
MDFNRFNHNRFQFKGVSKKGRNITILIAVLIVLLLVGMMTINWYTSYIWMDSLDFGSIYTTIFGTKFILGAAGFTLFALVTFFSLIWIRRSYSSHFDAHQLPPILQQRKTLNWIFAGVSVAVGLIGSSTIQGLGWEPALKVMNYVSFGQTDPIFHMDISFYMFVLPFLQFVVNVLLSLSVFFLLIEIAAYSVFHMYRISRSAQWHLRITIFIIGVLLACMHLLTPFETLLSNRVNMFQESIVHGLSYTDRIINIPVSYLLAAVSLLGAIWLGLALRKANLKAIALPVIVYIGVAVLGQGASIIVQNFIVSPNEFSRESPYLEHNLNFTRTAYDLNNMEENEHPGNNDSLDEALVERNRQTFDNVRINDARPLEEVYNQLQTFRTYYNFNDIDIDRYEMDGNYQQVFIGARELNTEDLPSQAQSWLNQTLRYTHGYGIAMSQVNDVTSQGQPQYMVQNLPSEGEVDVSRPQIYFGEEDYNSVIVQSKVDEFDYPSGDENVATRYEEESGIPLDGLNRFLFALDEGSFRMFVSGQITGESRLLQTRNIVERVKRIAPFFEYDEDPYIFVREDGSLAWLMDAYLTGAGYPYAENYDGVNNYIKNPVKVMIDAYSGEVSFFITEPDEPLVQSYKMMFPDLFTEEIPEDVRAHFRYPERLFKIQAEMYGAYHMTNLELFYNREDYWQFPTERYYNNDIEMEPYYMTMKLPESDKEEFILMMPYTPRNRQNMIAWIGVRNDGENYGQKFVYRFPKQKNVYGPQQIENRINQDSVISQELNLWSQGGSSVIRGNLLAIPIEDTLLYVEPIYIESANETSLPEVKQIVLAYGDYIVMEATFDEALNEILKLVKGEAVPETDPQQETGDEGEQETETEEPILGAEEKLRQVSDLFKQYQDALSQGNWTEAGEIMTEIEELLQ